MHGPKLNLAAAYAKNRMERAIADFIFIRKDFSNLFINY